jgi:hypothetical protein
MGSSRFGDSKGRGMSTILDDGRGATSVAVALEAEADFESAAEITPGSSSGLNGFSSTGARLAIRGAMHNSWLLKECEIMS